MTRHHRLGRTVATLLALGIGVAACGSAGAGVSSHAARSLHDAVRSVRVAAAVGDHDAAVAATQRLETELAAQRADGRVSADADARIRRAIARASIRPRADPDDDHHHDDHDHHDDDDHHHDRAGPSRARRTARQGPRGARTEERLSG